MVAIDLCDGVQNQRAGNMGGKCGRWQGYVLGLLGLRQRPIGLGRGAQPVGRCAPLSSPRPPPAAAVFLCHQDRGLSSAE